MSNMITGNRLAALCAELTMANGHICPLSEDMQAGAVLMLGGAHKVLNREAQLCRNSGLKLTKLFESGAE